MWFARTYDPLQAGSIDGTDVTPHDHAIKRAMNAHYEPPNHLRTDPLKTIFVGRLNYDTTKASVCSFFEKYGRITDVELVYNIVTGAFEGYGFVTFERSRDARNAYERAHRSTLDGREILVDYERSRVMKDWVPRRLGGGFGGKKESGQLRFGARDKPFRQPVKHHGQSDPEVSSDQRRPDNWRTLSDRRPSRSPRRSRRSPTPPLRNKRPSSRSSRSRYSPASPPSSRRHHSRHDRYHRSPSRRRSSKNRSDY